ncbi:apicoplast pyruvate carrier 1-like [Antedon mediterranea]|uniref:apicoplast pyruvate carrier 1-like n=1 Tax=Antedon mediterranea TaxID=105859 RepID=UPI003AF52780
MMTSRFASVRWKAWLVILGGVLIHITLGSRYTFGNLTSYITSYLRERTPSEGIRYKDTTSIFLLLITCYGATVPLGGVLDERVGPRLVSITGCWLASLGVFLTYFSIQDSFYSVLLTYGLIFGIGSGIAYIPALVCAMKWMPEKKGLVNGLITGGHGIAAVIWNPIETEYINPDNLSPNSSLKEEPTEKYFAEAAVLDRVPSCFLILGITFACIQFFGVLLLFDPPIDEPKSKEPSQEDEKHLTDADGGEPLQIGGEYNTFAVQEGDSDKEMDTEEERDLVDEKWTGLDIPPFEVYTETSFWILWSTHLITVLGIVFIMALYKAYGQTMINDDYFLSLTGSISAVFNGGGRIFWGCMADKFSYKGSTLAMCGSMIVFLLTLDVVSRSGGQYAYLVWICLINISMSGTFSLIPTATARAFGAKHVGANYGLVYSSQIITGPLGALLATTLTDRIGWFGMFILLATFYLGAFIITLLFNVKTRKGENI